MTILFERNNWHSPKKVLTMLGRGAIMDSMIEQVSARERRWP